MMLSEMTLGERRGEEGTWGQVILDQEKRRSPQRGRERGTSKEGEQPGEHVFPEAK